jgi:hypothetical protein
MRALPQLNAVLIAPREVRRPSEPLEVSGREPVDPIGLS